MSKHDSLGDRMKKYEDVYRHYLPTRTYTIIRLDGKSFHTFTAGCVKPFDRDLMDCMQFTTLKLCEEIQNVKLGYTQSDEITLVLTDFESLNTAQWFDGNLNKIVSVSAGIATAEFNKHWILKSLAKKPSDVSESQWIDRLESAIFDARPIVVSDPWEAFNEVLWRQNDASKNSVQMLARHLYPHKELQNVKIPQLHDMIHAKGMNWDKCPTDCKRGAFVVKGQSGWVIDREAPILSQDKEYFFSRVPQIDGYRTKIYKVMFYAKAMSTKTKHLMVSAYDETQAVELAKTVLSDEFAILRGVELVQSKSPQILSEYTTDD